LSENNYLISVKAAKGQDVGAAIVVQEAADLSNFLVD
jgi:hypothetical protein